MGQRASCPAAYDCAEAHGLGSLFGHQIMKLVRQILFCHPDPEPGNQFVKAGLRCSDGCSGTDNLFFILHHSLLQKILLFKACFHLWKFFFQRKIFIHRHAGFHYHSCDSHAPDGICYQLQPVCSMFADIHIYGLLLRLRRVPLVCH